MVVVWVVAPDRLRARTADADGHAECGRRRRLGQFLNIAAGAI